MFALGMLSLLITTVAASADEGRAFQFESKSLNIKAWVSEPGLDPTTIEIGEEIFPGGEDVLAWTPMGENINFSSPQCSKESIAEVFRSTRDTGLQRLRLASYLQRCETEINISEDPIPPLAKRALLGLPLRSNPFVRKVKITLSDSRVLFGFLTLKPDLRARPLIIAQCGLFCNLSDSSTHRNFIAHFFDESPFHVLTLGSITGKDFQRANGIPALGGFDEGRQIYQVAQFLRSSQSPFHDRISSVHAVGVSLGGQAALYSALYDSMNGQNTLQSAIALCPVVSLKNSMTDIYAGNPIGIVARFLTVLQLREVFRYIPILGELLDISERLTRQQVFDSLSLAATVFYQRKTAETPWDLKPFLSQSIASREDFWAWNQFSDFAHHLTTPTMVVAAQDDRIVRTPANSGLLTNEKSQALNVVTLQKGDHCGFAEANGWANISTLLREYVLSHSPEFYVPSTKSYEWVRIDDLVQKLKWPRNYSLGRSESVAGYRWNISSSRDEMDLFVTIFDSYKTIGQGEGLCYYHSPYHAPRDCYRTIAIQVPLNRLAFANQRVGSSDYQANWLSRMANTRLQILDAQGMELAGGRGSPTYIRFH